MTTEPEPEPAPARPKRGLKQWLLRLVIAGGGLGTAMGIGLAMIFAPYKLPAGSMWPAFNLGDRVIANRLAKEPFRGVMMVFHFPEHHKSLYMKRIVGLPGDVITVADGELAINGWRVPRCVVGKASLDAHEGTLFLESLGSARYLVFLQKVEMPALQGPYKVAPGEYFAMGDNRNNSHDSRTWFEGKGGGVPSADTVGRVVGHESAELPKGAEELGPALAACLAKQPEQTDPPAAN